MKLIAIVLFAASVAVVQKAELGMPLTGGEKIADAITQRLQPDG